MTTTSARQQQGQGDQISQGLERVKQIQEPTQAWAQVTVAPSLMVYEARYALQQLREVASQQETGEGTLIQIVEPLARAVGWAEGLAFAFDRIGPHMGQPFDSSQSKR